MIRELYSEVYIDNETWYGVVLERDESVEGFNAYELSVYLYKDDTDIDPELVAGTPLFDAGNGLPTLIESRKDAVKTFNIVVVELMALVHIGRTPKHLLLTMLNDHDKIEAARKEFEDLYYIVIE